MAANFQHMGGQGQMMPQQQRQQQHQQQRSQQGAAASTQIQQIIFQTLNSQTGPLTGWQAGVLPTERMGLIFNIIASLRLTSQHAPNPPTLHRMIEIGLAFEKEVFNKSPNKDQYKQAVAIKLDQLLERRTQNQGMLQQQIQQQAQSQALMQQQNAQQSQAQQMLMNQQNSMAGHGPRPMPQQPNQQGFSHLQHQMTASPLPGQQPQQAPMVMPNQVLPQNMTQNQQQQFQMNMEQQRSQQNGPGRPGQPQQPQLSAQDNALVMELTNRMLNATSEEDKNNLRANMQQRIDPVHLQRCQAQGVDPLFVYFRNQALTRLRQEKQARMSQAQQLAMGQQGQNVASTAPAMQSQRSVNPSPLTGQAQPPAPMGGNPNFEQFMGNMGDVATQQQGVMAEQAGQMVVPASAAPRNATSQPVSMTGQSANMNEQRNAGNMNVNAQQRQQMLHSQQMQQHRLQQSMQQQSQAQVRMNAQNKAQQTGLQGQPGGMGPGPVPPQQSPAMATLNAPLRTPSQQMNHPETPQINPAAKFGAPLDPRFMQANQRQPGQGNTLSLAGINPTIFNSLDPQQQQQMAALPPDKLNEVVNKWNETRPNTQAGRPQMPMQGNPQVRPGQQMPQAGLFNAPNSGNQFINPNGGQRIPPSMTTGMNQAQQLLRQQFAAANMNGRGQMQQGNIPIAPDQQQRLALQIDDMQIPPHLIGHPKMPQGVPTNEIKKWGQLKKWTAQNPSLPPTSVEDVKQLQGIHYRQILAMRTKQQQMQAAGLTQSAQTGQLGNAAIPPGMAPVAPMGTNSMPPNGMNMGSAIRQPTPFEIQAFRNHPSGKMITATDDQIRVLYMQNMQANAMQQGQLTPLQQEQRNQMMQQIQLQRLQQASTQQVHQAGQPQLQANVNLVGQTQAKPAQMPHPKQAQKAPEQVSGTGNNANGTRNSRPQTAAKNQAQNSSPAQPAKNLKRASSDDVVEVPNPNTPQGRPAQQSTQASNQQPQMQRLAPTPAQIAALDPEKRKKYEAMLKVSQANMQNKTMQMDPAMQEKLEAIKKEERNNFRDSHPDIPMDEFTRKLTAQRIVSIIEPLTSVGKILSRWFQITSDEEQARKYCRIRLRIMKQFKDDNMKQLKDNFSITAQEVDSARNMMNAMVQDLSARFPHMKKQDGARPQPGSAAQPSQPAPVPAPLNAANLQQQQQQLNKIHQRSNSRSSHPPAAPTSSQPPFQFGATSPHGAPAYIGNSKITQDHLQLPARKKQKQNSTPGSTASPQVAKAASPEIKRQGEPRPQAKSTLCCLEPDCDRHTVGFESEEALAQHNKEEHIRPTENPEKYAGESLASVLGLNSQGQPKKAVSNTGQAAAGAGMVPNGSKQGQTPNIKNESISAAATPMNRQVSMNRQASATGGKPNMQKANLAKDASTKLQSVQKDAQTSAQQDPATKPDPWANSIIDPYDLLQSFQPFETGAGGAISDLNVYRSITPNDTPESSKDGVSEPNSDISEGVGLDINLDIFDDSWQPFGPNDTHDLFDTNGFNVSGGDEDVAMFDDEPSAVVYQSWDDMMDPAAFDKPFQFDTSLYSMSAD